MRLPLFGNKKAEKETSPSQERGEVSEGVGGPTGEEEHRHPLRK
jgi:hypothetical protein